MHATVSCFFLFFPLHLTVRITFILAIDVYKVHALLGSDINFGLIYFINWLST